MLSLTGKTKKNTRHRYCTWRIVCVFSLALSLCFSLALCFLRAGSKKARAGTARRVLIQTLVSFYLGWFFILEDRALVQPSLFSCCASFFKSDGEVSLVVARCKFPPVVATFSCLVTTSSDTTPLPVLATNGGSTSCCRSPPISVVSIVSSAALHLFCHIACLRCTDD